MIRAILFAAIWSLTVSIGWAQEQTAPQTPADVAVPPAVPEENQLIVEFHPRTGEEPVNVIAFHEQFKAACHCNIQLRYRDDVEVGQLILVARTPQEVASREQLIQKIQNFQVSGLSVLEFSLLTADKVSTPDGIDQSAKVVPAAINPLLKEEIARFGGNWRIVGAPLTHPTDGVWEFQPQGSHLYLAWINGEEQLFGTVRLDTRESPARLALNLSNPCRRFQIRDVQLQASFQWNSGKEIQSGASPQQLQLKLLLPGFDDPTTLNLQRVGTEPTNPVTDSELEEFQTRLQQLKSKQVAQLRADLDLRIAMHAELAKSEPATSPKLTRMASDIQNRERALQELTKTVPFNWREHETSKFVGAWIITKSAEELGGFRGRLTIREDQGSLVIRSEDGASKLGLNDARLSLVRWEGLNRATLELGTGAVKTVVPVTYGWHGNQAKESQPDQMTWSLALDGEYAKSDREDKPGFDKIYFRRVTPDDIGKAPDKSVQKTQQAIVLIIDPNARQSEVVKQVVEALEKAGIAKAETSDTAAPSNSKISVTLSIRPDVSFEKIKHLIEALQKVGASQIAFRAMETPADWKETHNFIRLTAQPDYSTEELLRIEQAIEASAIERGLEYLLEKQIPGQTPALTHHAATAPKQAPAATDSPARVSETRVLTVNGCTVSDIAQLLKHLNPDPSFQAFGNNKEFRLVVIGTPEQLASAEKTVNRMQELVTQISVGNRSLYELLKTLGTEHPNVLKLNAELEALDTEIVKLESGFKHYNPPKRIEEFKSPPKLGSTVPEPDPPVDPNKRLKLGIVLHRITPQKAAQLLKLVIDDDTFTAVPEENSNILRVTGTKLHFEILESVLRQVEQPAKAAHPQRDQELTFYESAEALERQRDAASTGSGKTEGIDPPVDANDANDPSDPDYEKSVILRIEGGPETYAIIPPLEAALGKLQIALAAVDFSHNKPDRKDDFHVALVMRSEESPENIATLIDWMTEREVYDFTFSTKENPENVVLIDVWNETVAVQQLIESLQNPVDSPVKFDFVRRDHPKGTASVKVLALKYAQATEVAEVLKQVYDKGPAKIVPDARTNSVIVTGPEAQLQEIEALLLKLDEADRNARVQPKARVVPLETEAAKLSVQLQDELAKLQQSVGPQHPKVKELQAGIAAARKSLGNTTLKDTASVSPEEAVVWSSMINEVIQELEKEREAVIDKNLGKHSPRVDDLNALIAQYKAANEGVFAKAANEQAQTIARLKEVVPQFNAAIAAERAERDRLVKDDPTNPRIRELDQSIAEEIVTERNYVKAIAAAESGVSAGLPGGVPLNLEVQEASIKELQQQVTQLRKEYEVADHHAHQLARNLKQSPDEAKQSELRKSVRKAFTARQSLLRAELLEMQSRLLQTQRSIEMRERISDQIIQRRVEDLLNPQLEWEGTPSRENGITDTAKPEQRESGHSNSPQPPGVKVLAAPDENGMVLVTFQPSPHSTLEQLTVGQKVFVSQTLRPLQVGYDHTPIIASGCILKEFWANRQRGASNQPVVLLVPAGDENDLIEAEKSGALEVHAESRSQDGRLTPIDAPPTATSSITIDPQAAMLAKLQGVWEVEVQSEDVPKEKPPFRVIAEIRDNVMTWSLDPPQPDNDKPPVFLIKLAEPGTPEPVDLVMNPNDGKDRVECPGIIEIGDNMVRFCVNTDDSGLRPEVFATGKAADLWILRRPAKTSSTFLGVQLAPAPVGSDQLKDTPFRGGLRIEKVYAETPAAGGGLLAGDILVGLGAWEVAKPEDLQYALGRSLEGEVSFHVLRDGQVRKGYVLLDGTKRPASDAELTPEQLVKFTYEYQRGHSTPASQPDPKAAMLAKLQGAWDVKQIFEKEENGELVTVTLKALIEENRISLSGTDGSNPATFDLQLGPAGPPQQVDLKPVLTPAEREDSREHGVTNVNPVFLGIIEVTDDGIRLCLDNSQLDKRPIVFAPGPATAIWDLRRAISEAVSEIEGDWHLERQGTVDQPPNNLTIRGDQYTVSSPNDTYTLRMTLDQKARTIQLAWPSNAELLTKSTYELSGDRLTMRGGDPPQVNVWSRGHRSWAATELEGDWHLVSDFDDKGKPRELGPSNWTFRGDRRTNVWPGGSYVCRIKVNPTEKTLWSYSKEEDGSFGQEYYELKGHQLILRDKPGALGYQILERGHVRIPLVVPPTTDEQKLRWRSAVVDIYRVQPESTVLIGRGVVVSPTGLILTNTLGYSLGGEAITARFDDGRQVKLSVVDGAASGYYSLQTAEATVINHYFEISAAPHAKGDEVYICGYDNDGRGTFGVHTTHLTLDNRKIQGLDTPGWQLQLKHPLSNNFCQPLLSAEGQLVGLTMAGMGNGNQLLLACPASTFDNVFGKAMLKVIPAQAAGEEHPQPVPSLVTTQLDPLLEKLQGAWDMHMNTADPFQPRGQKDVVIQNDLMTITSAFDVNDINNTDIPVQLKPGPAGSPQQIDLIYFPNDRKNRLEFLGIIELFDDTVRICMSNSSDPNRPTAFAAGKDANLWELRRQPAVHQVSELEGDWHLESATDTTGKPREIKPDNWTIRGRQMVFDFSSGIQYVCQIDVDSQTKTIRWIKDGKGVFGQADYVLRDDQLTLHERPNMVKVLRRGHVKLEATASPTSEAATTQEGGRHSEKQGQENPSPSTPTIPGDQ